MLVSKEQQKFKAFVKKIIIDKNIKLVGDGRGEYHIRFPLKGNLKGFNDFFIDKNINVTDSQQNVSHKYKGYLLTAKEGVDNVPVGTTLEWVNSEVSLSDTGSKLFATKDLSPDSLGVTNKLFEVKKLIDDISEFIRSKYKEPISDDLIKLLNYSKQKNHTINFSEALHFDKDDLVVISKDLGEVLASIWLVSNFNFSKVFFPINSNEKLIDFYGKKVNICYPVSVKSSGGGKVLLQNIIDAINKRKKNKKVDIQKEPSYKIIKLVNDNSMKKQMLKIHQFLQTKVIEDLSTIVDKPYNEITIEYLETWLSNKTPEEIKSILRIWWKKYSQPRERTLKGNDKLRFIISPLGESIKNLLNKDEKLKQSLNRLANEVSILQINVDVKRDKIIFKKSFFKNSTFKFDWPGYSSGNKLGFLKE